jgi:hypothetical protein
MIEDKDYIIEVRAAAAWAVTTHLIIYLYPMAAGS